MAGLRESWPVEESTAIDSVEEQIGQVHDERYVELFRRAVERGDGLLGSSDNPLSSGTWEAALAAVEATLGAAEWVAGGRNRHAFAAVRPPGHHAERNLAMGFCYFNNIAVAGEFLRRRHGMERLAIFDFDVHHGNGTQQIFEERFDVLYVSVHQWPFYPGTGAAGERGRGAGVGATLNIPLPGGRSDDGYRQVLETQVVPAIADFGPRCLLVSAGFDAWRADPVGGMRVSERGFAEWGELLRALADECCDGRLLSVLEGGYDIGSLPALVDSYLRGRDDD
jgi:acetoin utilization deacetylase AcuC-like enzyme